MNHDRTKFVPRIGQAAMVAFALSLTALIGCGGSPSVSGKITYKGKPVEGGSLTFVPKEVGRPAGGNVQAEGNYVLSDRAAPGKYKVSFSPPVTELPPGKELKPGQAPAPSPWDRLAPKQQEVEVQPGSNTIDIELVPISVR